MRLETERLVIRPWRVDEAPRLLDIKSRVEVVRWLGDEPGEVEPMRDLEEARESIRRDAELEPPLGVWAIEVAAEPGADGPGGPVGSVMLVPIPDSDGLVQVGWHLHPDAWGRGWATEAARAVVAHGLASGLPEVHALTHLDNHASVTVARRAGLRYVGVTHDWYATPSHHFVTP